MPTIVLLFMGRIRRILAAVSRSGGHQTVGEPRDVGLLIIPDVLSDAPASLRAHRDAPGIPCRCHGAVDLTGGRMR